MVGGCEGTWGRGKKARQTRGDKMAVSGLDGGEGVAFVDGKCSPGMSSAGQGIAICAIGCCEADKRHEAYTVYTTRDVNRRQWIGKYWLRSSRPQQKMRTDRSQITGTKDCDVRRAKCDSFHCPVISPSPGILTPNEMQSCPFANAFFFIPRHVHARLNEAELGGGNVESIDIGGQAGESLLGAVRAASSVSLVASVVPAQKLLTGSGC